MSSDVIPGSPDTRRAAKRRTSSLVSTRRNSSTTTTKRIDLGPIRFEDSEDSSHSQNSNQSGRSNQNETQHKKQPNSSHISQNSNQSIPTQSPSQSQMFQRNNLNPVATRQLSTPSKSQKKSLPVPAMSPVEAAQPPNNIMVRVNQLEQRLRAFEEQNRRREDRMVTVRPTTREYVRVCTRTLINDPSNDLDWDFNFRVNTGPNHATTEKIKQNVMALDRTITEIEFRVAGKTYFNSSKSYKSRRSEQFLIDTAKNGRKKTKLVNRKKALKRSTTIPDVDKLVIKEALSLEFMSSEEEREDDEDLQHFEIRPLRWRTRRCDKYFEALDKRHWQRLSKKSQRMTVQRKMGPYSCRGPPNVTDANSWAISTN